MQQTAMLDWIDDAAQFAVSRRTFTRTADVKLGLDDVLNGVRGNPYVDPIGHAVKRAVPWSRNVRVSLIDIAFDVRDPITGEVARHVAATPHEAAAWLERFDAGRPPMPLSFVLEWEVEA